MPRHTGSPIKLLVPLDGSPLAEQAIPYARMLARLFPAEIHLLRVVAPSLVDRLVRYEAVLLGAAGDELGERSEQDERMRDALREEGTAYLEQQAKALDAHARRVHHELVFGTPADQIAAAATRQGSDMIVIATHGRGGLMRWALGGVTSRVLQLAAQPVLVVRGSEEPPETVAAPKRVLMALDGSPLAERAIPLGARIAHAAHAEVLLAQVIEAPDGPLAAFADAEATARLRELALSYLGHVARTIAAEVGGPISTSAPVGHVAEEIVEEAERRRIGLIVMGRHGLGGARPAFLGGTAEKVSQASRVPLLIVG